MAPRRRNNSSSSSSSGNSNAARRNRRNDNHESFFPTSVNRIMQRVLPNDARITEEAREAMVESVSQFIRFITREATRHTDNAARQTLNGEDIIHAMHELGFHNYVDPLMTYLNRYRESEGLNNAGRRTRNMPLISIQQPPQVSATTTPPPPVAPMPPPMANENLVNQVFVQNLNQGLPMMNQGPYPILNQNPNALMSNHFDEMGNPYPHLPYYPPNHPH